MSVTTPRYRLFPKIPGFALGIIHNLTCPFAIPVIRAQIVVHAGVIWLSEIKSRVGTLDNAPLPGPIPPVSSARVTMIS